MVEEEIIGKGQIERKHVQWFNFSTILRCVCLPVCLLKIYKRNCLYDLVKKSHFRQNNSLDSEQIQL